MRGASLSGDGVTSQERGAGKAGSGVSKLLTSRGAGQMLLEEQGNRSHNRGATRYSQPEKKLSWDLRLRPTASRTNPAPGAPLNHRPDQTSSPFGDQGPHLTLTLNILVTIPPGQSCTSA